MQIVRIKLIPVAIGITREKLFVDKALKNERAENTINIKATIKGMLSTSFNHSLTVPRLFSFKCHLIKAAPETFKTVYSSMYKMVIVTYLFSLFCVPL